jgi:hypothetical protein
VGPGSDMGTDSVSVSSTKVEDALRLLGPAPVGQGYSPSVCVVNKRSQALRSMCVKCFKLQNAALRAPLPPPSLVNAMQPC